MAIDKREGWLAGLIVGDAVIVANYYNESVGKVEKITPTGRITVGRTTYDADGREYGSSRGYHPYRLREATQDKIEDIRQKSIIANAMRAMDSCKKVTYEQAVKILEILEVE